MKIIIDFEDKHKENIVYDNVTQFTLAGNHVLKKTIPATFRMSIISEPNFLIGLCEMLKEDIHIHRDKKI